MGLLSDYLGWQKCNDDKSISSDPHSDKVPAIEIKETSDEAGLAPTTPIPIVDTAWMQMQIDAAPRNRKFYYKPGPLTGIDACHAALNACKRKHGIVSTTIWIPKHHMQELWIDIPELYQIPFQGFIPYSYSRGELSPDGQIKFPFTWVKAIGNDNISNGDIICMLF